MALKEQDYNPALKYGADILGSNLVENYFYGSVAVNTSGSATNVALFTGSTKTAFAGTITSVSIVCPDTTKGTIDLVSDQGTLVRMIKNGTANAIVGSFINPIAFQNGSLLYAVSAGADNATFEASFYTAN